MGATNSSLDLWDAIDSGGGERKIVAMNSHDDPTLGFSIGKDLEQQLGITEGDVVFVEADEDDGCLKIHLPPNRG